MTHLRFGLYCYASLFLLHSTACGPAPSASGSSRLTASASQNTATAETRLRSDLLTILKSSSGELPENAAVTAISDRHAQQISETPENTAFQVKAAGDYHPVPPAAIEVLLQQKRLYTSDNLITISLSDGDAEQLKARFKEELERVMGTMPFSHYGLSLLKKGPSWFMSCILISEVVQLENPLAMRYDAATTVAFNGEISMPGFANPKVLMTPPDGRVVEVSPRQTGKTFNTQLNLDQTGLYSIEVDVEGPFGPQPACNFIVAVGVPYPEAERTQDLAKQQITSVSAAQNELLKLLNTDREALGLKPLKLHSMLNTISQAHSQDMVDHGFVGHNSPTEGTPQQQAFAFNLSANVAQNVAVNQSLAQAHHKLMSSPGHRQTLLSPAYTHAGFGVVANPEGRLYITQNFIEEKLILDPLPLTVKAAADFAVEGIATETGVVGLFIDQSQHSVTPVKAGERFRLPVAIKTPGAHRLLMGFSATPEATQLQVYNLWDLDVTP
jgi:uncharacterized protein YkwD